MTRKSLPTRSRTRAMMADGQAQAVLQAAAPVVAAVVGAGRGELVDEIALAAHDLDAVVAGLAGQRRRGGVVLDGAEDVGLGHAPGRVRVDRRGDRGRADRAVDPGVAPGMQDLQRDPAACVVHRFGDGTVLGELLAAVEQRRARLHQPFGVGREAAGDDQRRPTFGALDIEARDPLERPIQRLQPRVHGAHDDAVGEPDGAEVERLEQVRKGGHGRASMIVARDALGLGDLLVLDRRLQHHAVGELVDHAALDLLPGRLVRGILDSRRGPAARRGACRTPPWRSGCRPCACSGRCARGRRS